MQKRNLKIINKDQIKALAMLLMLLNHISLIFLESGSFLGELFLDLGFFTAITMCFFLVEGFHYTHSKLSYARRLLIFALLSEFPYCLALTEGTFLEFQGFNMLFTLFLCLYILIIQERPFPREVKVLLISLLFLLSLRSDWGFFAPLFVVLFSWSRGNIKKQKTAYLISTLLFGLASLASHAGSLSLPMRLLLTLGNMGGPALSGIVILYLYKDVRRKKKSPFVQWFFYIFYPLHLLILGLIRIALL